MLSFNYQILKYTEFLKNKKNKKIILFKKKKKLSWFLIKLIRHSFWLLKFN